MFNDDCDARSVFDPRSEVPAWFWELIARGRQHPDTFRAVLRDLMREELREFIHRLDELAGFFHEPPFVPPPPARHTEHHLQDTGRWLISQGEAAFLRAWDQPEVFWGLVAEDVIDLRPDDGYVGLAEEEWFRRYPDEDP